MSAPASFLSEDFLLRNETAKRLFWEIAADQPIIDYHCHLSPQEIAEDKRFSSITELWLKGDHYKWRLLRAAGVDENEITGSASEEIKFRRWAEILPWCIGNPVYHWTHLELQKYFNIQTILNAKTAKKIREQCNELLASPVFSARNIIKKSNVELICTTDDPIDDLRWHRQIAEDNSFEVKVLPTFRPDQIIHICSEDFIGYMEKLETCSGITIKNLNDLKEALSLRIDFFHEHGCRLSDHALGDIPHSYCEQEKNIDKIFSSIMAGKSLNADQVDTYRFHILKFLAKIYSQKNWTMQYHIGALRNVNPPNFKKLGADSGFDAVNDTCIAEKLGRLFGEMEEAEILPKTILYNVNPKDNFVLATLMGAFQNDKNLNVGKFQFGSGWWHLDQKDGMIRQMTDLANLGVLGKFIGMLTDSRSFLSYSRHEYFRRIFCNLIGTWVENGEYPNDKEALKRIIEGVCYFNAQKFLNFSDQYGIFKE